MANKGHLKQLGKGRAAWQQWRASNPEVVPDLSDADFSSWDLVQYDLRHADFSRANLCGADLLGASLDGADLTAAVIADANLNEASLNHSTLTGANLTRSNFTSAHLRGATLIKANFSDANLSLADLNGAVITGASFLSANMAYTDLTEADLRGADFKDADLRSARFDGASLILTNFSYANISRASFHSADTRSAKFNLCRFEDGPPLFLDDKIHPQPINDDGNRNIAVIVYENNVTEVEYGSIPILVSELQSLHPGTKLQIDGIVSVPAGQALRILIARPGNNDLDQLRAEIEDQGRKLLAAYRQLEQKDKIISKLNRDMDLLKVDYGDLARRVLSDTSDAGSTKELLVAFLDLTGFSKLPDDDKEKKVQRIWHLASGFVAEGGGIYVNTWGDAVVAAFTNAHEGLKCICLLRDALRGIQLPARIGVNWGTARVLTNPATKRLDIVGQSVDLAARLEPIGEEYDVLASEDVCVYIESTGGSPQLRFTRRQLELKKGAQGHQAGAAVVCYQVDLLIN